MVQQFIRFKDERGDIVVLNVLAISSIDVSYTKEHTAISNTIINMINGDRYDFDADVVTKSLNPALIAAGMGSLFL